MFKEGAVRADKLPNYERTRLESAKSQLIGEVKDISSADISNIKLYLIPGDSEMQATAFSGQQNTSKKSTSGSMKSWLKMPIRVLSRLPLTATAIAFSMRLRQLIMA